ncbi:Ku protein [Streptomyces cirratus]
MHERDLREGKAARRAWSTASCAPRRIVRHPYDPPPAAILAGVPSERPQRAPVSANGWPAAGSAPHTGRCAGRPGPLRHGLPVRRPPPPLTCAAGRLRQAPSSRSPTRTWTRCPCPTAKVIEIVAFVPTESIDLIRIGSSSYLAAEGVAAKPYELLRQALELSPKVAVAKFAMRDRERLGLLRVLDDVIVLRGMRWVGRDPGTLPRRRPRGGGLRRGGRGGGRARGHPFREGSRRDARQVPARLWRS